MSAHTEAPSASVFKPFRNQLGVIALLIFLIYALVSIVIGFSGHIDASQKWPLVWFLVVFPLLVLAIFGWLLSRHHGKLVIAGAEAGSGEMFLSTLTPDQQRRKLSKELNVYFSPSESVGEDQGQTDSALPTSFSDSRSLYLVAEDLVLRQIELDRGPNFMRHVTLEGVPFDGVIVREDKVIAVEVKYLTSSHVKQSMTGALLDNAEYAATRLKRTRPNASFTFLLAVVTQMSDEEQTRLKANLVNKFGVTPVDIDIEFFDLKHLENAFASQDGD
jgi:hypothetical protein